MDQLTQAMLVKLELRGYQQVGENAFIGNGFPRMYATVDRTPDMAIVTLKHEDCFCDSFIMQA